MSALAGAEKIAAAAQLQILFGERKAVRRALENAEPLARRVAVRADHQKTPALLAPAPHSAAQLVQLRKPEALGIHDDHDGRVGHVHADLDDGGRDEAVIFVIFERCHDGALFPVLHSAVQQPEADVGKPLLQFLPQFGDGGHFPLVIVDLGAHEVCLPPLFALPAHIAEHVLVLVGGDDGGRNGLACERLVGDGGHVQIAVKDERERARDRRCRHDEHVGRLPLFAELVALGDAEAVLLIADAEGKVLEVYVPLQDGVRAA